MTLNLEAIKARCEKATAGEPFRDGTVWQARSFRPNTQIATKDLRHVALVGNDDDADFIAHARTDLPALVAEVERLRKVEAAARAWREVFRSPPKLRTPHNHRSYSHAVSNARCRVFAALDAAQGGG